ncbi:MAG TPA: T9SS type A sorting domain-containing protein [Bacteroidota bacterium]|nr:T9SS type A sorting domain-containing protein [Bacteroidota bacterium]
MKDTAAPPIDRTTINSIATTFLVSDASDAPDPDLNDGLYAPPTLRSAIDNANHLGGAHAIVFAPGLTVIQPLLQLSAIQGPVNIDGTVAAGKIILDGSLGPVNSFGLLLGGTSTVRNMHFRSWSNLGLALSGGAANSIIQKNVFSLNNIGLNVNSANTLIGGENPDDRNLAYGNMQDGIDVVFADDNTVQHNFCGTPDGLTANPNASSGVYVMGQRTRVLGNLLSGNNDLGLEISQYSVNTLVRDNIIGADSSRRGRLPNNGDGIKTFAFRDSIINNVITGNAYGITMLGQAAETFIHGNIIGPNGTLDSLFGNLYDGLQILGANAVIDSNIVSGNKYNGIKITGHGGAVVRRNMIGTDPTGTLDWGNTIAGIFILTDTNTIGGPSPGDRNVLSGNDGAGIEMYGGIQIVIGDTSTRNYVRGNVIQNNLIGTDITGTLSLPNYTGLFMNGYIDSNFVRNNLISGNRNHGVWTRRTPSAPSRNLFQGNRIGTQVDGISPLPNDSAGVMIDSADVNLIGGADEADANIIAFHQLPGIAIKAGRGIAVMRNSIFGNRGLGIDLGNDGPTLNDSADVDSGANGLQNFPRITWLDPAGGSTTVKGHLRSLPETDYRLDFYTNDEADTTGFGEGQTFQYTVDIHTDTGGMATFEVIIPGAHGRVVATATHPDLGTSEFSKSLLVVNSVADRPAVNPTGGTAATSGPQVNGVPEVTLRSAIQASNHIDGEDDIVFNIPGPDPYFIQPQSPYPAVSGDIVVDGSTQPNYDSTAVPVIRLLGSAAGPTADGLHLMGELSSVRALHISGFPGDGIRMDGGHLRLTWMTTSGNKGCGVRAAKDVTLAGACIFSSNGPSTDLGSIECTAPDLAGLWLAGRLRGSGRVTASGNCGSGIHNDGLADTAESWIDLEADVTTDDNGLHGIFSSNDVTLKGDKFEFLSNGSPAWLGAGIYLAGGQLIIDATGTADTLPIRANGNSLHGISSYVGPVTLKGRSQFNNNGAGVSEVRCFNNVITGLVAEGSIHANTIEAIGNGYDGIRAGRSLFVDGDLTVKNQPGRGVWAIDNIQLDGAQHLLENNRDQAMWAANGWIDVKGVLTVRDNKIGGRHGRESGPPDLADAVVGAVLAYRDFRGEDVIIENNEPAGLSAWRDLLIRGNATVRHNALRGIFAMGTAILEGESHIISDNGGDGFSVNNGTIQVTGRLVVERNGADPGLVPAGEGYGINAQIVEIRDATIRDNALHGVVGYTKILIQGRGIITGNGGSGLASNHFVSIAGGRVCDNAGYGILSPVVRMSGTQVCNNGVGGISGRVAGPAPGLSAAFAPSGAASAALSGSIVGGSSIDANTGDGIAVDNLLPFQISGSNIFGNTGFGVNNEGPGPVIADGNWWGSPSGPGGAIGGSVQASTWLSTPVAIYAGTAVDSVFVLPGEVDSLHLAVANWSNPEDSLSVSIADDNGWITPVVSQTVFLQDSTPAVISSPFNIPPAASIGEVSRVVITAGSLSNPGQTAADTFHFVVYQPALSEVTILRDTSVAYPGDTLHLAAIGFDQTGREWPLIPQWSAAGGTITTEGVYIAGPDTGMFIVAVSDSVTTLADSAVIRILQPAESFTPPVLGLSTSSVAMGDVPVGTRDSVPVSMTNTSGDILRIDSIRTRTAHFSAIYYPDVTQLRLGDTLELLIEFAPDSIRSYEDTLFIFSNATVSPAIVSINGNGAVTGVAAEDRGIPATYTLEQNYPNPFNPATTLAYGIPTRSRVTLRIYDVLGREVITLVDDVLDAGYGSVLWNSVNGHGLPISSGIYFYRLDAAGTTDVHTSFTQVRKMLLLR